MPVRYERYKRIENAVAASDSGGIFERWRFGRRLLCDSDASTPNGNLRHGVLKWLVERSSRSGRKLSEREIRYRIQCARTYPTEDQIRHASADFADWTSLREAGFPVYEAPPDARPYNPLETGELASQSDDRGRRLLESEQYEGGGLFPVDTFGPKTTLAELLRYAEEMAELTARFARRDDERKLYVDSLIKAVHGNMDATWEEAEAALRDGE